MFATMTTILAYEHIKSNYTDYYEWLKKCYEFYSQAKKKLIKKKKEKIDEDI